MVNKIPKYLEVINLKDSMMRKIVGTFVVFVLAFNFTSCSTDELTIDHTQEALLKQIELKRAADGSYSIAYQLSNKTISVAQEDVNSNSKEFYLSKVEFKTKEQHIENLALSENRLSVGFFDNLMDKSTKFAIEDENINFAKGSTSAFLKTYGVTSNDDGTIQLDFEVNDNVITEFLYNNVLGIHEIHLRKGTSKEKIFSRAIDIPITKILKIDFVNHILFGKGAAARTERKPRVVYDESRR